MAKRTFANKEAGPVISVNPAHGIPVPAPEGSYADEVHKLDAARKRLADAQAWKHVTAERRGIAIDEEIEGLEGSGERKAAAIADDVAAADDILDMQGAVKRAEGRVAVALEKEKRRNEAEGLKNIRVDQKERQQWAGVVAKAARDLGIAVRGLHKKNVKFAARLGDRRPPGLLVRPQDTVSLVALELARAGPSEPLYGGHKMEDLGPLLPGAASRAEQARAKLEGREGTIEEVIAADNAYGERAYVAGGKIPVQVEPVDAEALAALRPGSLKELVLKILELRAEKDRLAPFTPEECAYAGSDLNAVDISKLIDGEAITAALPKLSLLGSRQPIAEPPAPAPAMPIPAPAVDLSAPYILRLREGYEAAKAGNRDRRALRQLVDRYSGPGFDVELIPESKAEAFLAEIATLPEAVQKTGAT